MLSISSFEIINIVLLLLPNPKIFLCIHASAADATAVNPNGTKTLFANGLITLFIKGNPVFSNGPKVYREILLIASSLKIEFLTI